ncbi:MAG: hypothetical protein KGD70_01760 [Candidatus Lokiarchaeota archaeon]|nr:hypothetical protein [Candidatus Lokiarchaeota archaeon]
MDFGIMFALMFTIAAVIIVIVFVVIVYFIFKVFRGNSKRSERMSPAKPYPETVFKKEEISKFCKYCGAKFTEELVICPECGEQLD